MSSFSCWEAAAVAALSSSEAQPQQWDRNSKVVWQQDLNRWLCKKKRWQRIKNVASWGKLALTGVIYFDSVEVKHTPYAKKGVVIFNLHNQYYLDI